MFAFSPKGNQEKGTENTPSRASQVPDFLSNQVILGTHVPSRVQTQVGLCVKLLGARKEVRGIFCEGDIKTGDLIFKIKHPLLTIVSLSLSDFPFEMTWANTIAGRRRIATISLYL